MQKAAKTRRFLIDVSFKQRFPNSESVVICDSSLQRLVLSQRADFANPNQFFSEVTSRFIRLVEHSYNLRDLKRLEEASRVLMNLPLARARQIGLFYQALILKRTGQVDQAQACFESVADNEPLAYRARAIQALGALHYDKGQPSEALRFHLEAGRASLYEGDHNPLVALLVRLEISHIQAHVGDHDRALDGLEALASLVRSVAKQHPFYFYLYSNALAVEFGELGRIAEAEAACAIALASPFASAYPEWSETRDEIAAKRKSASPSVVSIHHEIEDGRTYKADRTPKANRTREGDRDSEAELAIKAESLCKPEPLRLVAFISPATNRYFFQRTRIPSPSTTTITLNATSILDRVLICIGPQAPPVS